MKTLPSQPDAERPAPGMDPAAPAFAAQDRSLPAELPGSRLPAHARLHFERLATAAELTKQAHEREAALAEEGASSARAPAIQAPPPPFAAGQTPDDSARLELYRMHSAVLPDDRVITVYLPPQYASAPDRRFPVFYLHDGQNLFDPMTSYIPGRTWQAGSTADRMNREGTAEPMILVGVANTGLRRMAEYTPSRDPRMGGGEGDAYGRLLTGELKPFIDRNYRTQPAPETTGIGGSSLGGLISLYLGFTHPRVFGRVAVLSPSIWWDQRSILRLVQRTQPRPSLRIWLDIGTAEGWRHVRDTERLAQMLRDRGWQDNLDLAFMLVEGGVHDEDAWAARFDHVLGFLFPPPSA